jgi:uncharacterized membrane-anchored protein
MFQLSPPSPQVRALVKMASIAGVIVGLQILLQLLTRWFTGEEIVFGICMLLIAGVLYGMFQMFVEQERRKDETQKMIDRQGQE